MIIYIFTLFLVIFMWIVMNNVKFSVRGKEKFKNRNRTYVICIGAWLFGVAALRNYTVGADTYTYLHRYTMFASSEWGDVFTLADRLMFEYGYVICNKLLSYISSNPRILLVITAFIIMFSYGLHIYDKSKMPWLSFFMFITLGMYGESFSLIRQYIAVALILISYSAIKNNKLIQFVVIIFLAASVHTSALIVLPMFWISKIRFNKIHFGILAGFSAFMIWIMMTPTFMISDRLINFFRRYTTYARYFETLGQVRGGAVGLTLIYFSFFILIVFKLYNSNIESRNMYIAFAMASAVLVLFSFITSISERILPYFSAMFIVSIPEALKHESKQIIRIQYTAIICIVLLIYYIGIICKADPFRLIPYELWDRTMYWF